MRITKKKKGNEFYYYLQHSVRYGKKVKIKEIYLGKKIPKNIENIKQKFISNIRKPLYKKFEKIKADFQKEWNKLPESVKDREKEEIAIAFTYNTNAIEGSKITLGETRDIIQKKLAPNKPIYDIKETEAHSKVYFNMLEKYEKISNDLLLKWHDDIFNETKKDISGKYRDYFVRVGNYRAPDWQDVKKLMSNLTIFINKNMEKMNAVELSARAHYRFEMIHPFGDGNGRIGRLLTNYILWHNKYPMIIIEYKKRRSYYKALEKGEEGFVNYFFRRYLSVHKKRIA